MRRRDGERVHALCAVVAARASGVCWQLHWGSLGGVVPAAIAHRSSNQSTRAGRHNPGPGCHNSLFLHCVVARVKVGCVLMILDIQRPKLDAHFVPVVFENLVCLQLINWF